MPYVLYTGTLETSEHKIKLNQPVLMNGRSINLNLRVRFYFYTQCRKVSSAK